MRILHLIPQFPYFGATTLIGGHVNSLFNLARAQAAAGDSVTIVSSVLGQSAERQIGEGISLVSLTASGSSGSVRYALAFLVRAGLWVTRNARAYDVVHVHSGFVDYVLLPAFVSMVLGKTSVHTLYCPISGDNGRWNHRLYHAMLAKSLASVDALTCISENISASVSAYCSQARAKVVPCAVDHKRYTPGDAQPYRRKLKLRDDELVILFVGNTKPQKNLSAVLHAFHRLVCIVSSARLVVTTELKHSATNVQMERLRCRAEELGLADRITQLGVIDDMSSLMRACDIMVAPFLDTQGPSDYFLAVLECMACGKPVVVSDVGGMSEVVDEQVGRLVNPHDVDEIAAALLELASDSALRDRLGQNGRRRIQKMFDPELIRASYQKLYESVVCQ